MTGWYAERLTPLGAWSSQVTPEKPREMMPNGTRQTLRRVRELEPHEAHLTLGALRAIEDQRAADAFQRAEGEIEDDGFVTIVPSLHPRDPVASAIGE